MSVLRIHLFGRVRVVHEDGSEIRLIPTVQTLLAYLLLQHTLCPRDVLACLCWCDQPDDQARSCLSTALWRLRRSLESEEVPRGTYLLATPTGAIGFNWASHHWLDMTTFEQEAQFVLALPLDALGPPQAEALQRAVSIYDGELLDGFYADWAIRERERLRCLYLDSLRRLMLYHHKHGALEESLATGQKILALDPLREEIHRDMMRLYVRNGQRALAVRQYKTCREILGDELDIPPMEETEAIYHEIIQDAEESRPFVVPTLEPTDLSQALHTLRQAMQDFERTRDRLQRAIQQIEHLTADSPNEPPVRPR